MSPWTNVCANSRRRDGVRRWHRTLLAGGLASAAFLLCGCSLFVMAGKMIMGYPERPAPFKKVTHVDLTTGEHQVLVVTRAPATIGHEMPSAELTITAQVSRVLANEEIAIFPSEKVLNWLDDRGGHWGSVQEVVKAFPDVDYIIEIKIDHLSCLEPHNKALLRGRANGSVSAYEVTEIGGAPSASPVFYETFNSTYPPLHAKQSKEISTRTFRKRFLDRLCRQIAQSFHDYRAVDAVY